MEIINEKDSRIAPINNFGSHTYIYGLVKNSVEKFFEGGDFYSCEWSGWKFLL